MLASFERGDRWRRLCSSTTLICVAPGKKQMPLSVPQSRTPSELLNGVVA